MRAQELSQPALRRRRQPFRAICLRATVLAFSLSLSVGLSKAAVVALKSDLISIECSWASKLLNQRAAILAAAAAAGKLKIAENCNILRSLQFALLISISGGDESVVCHVFLLKPD